MNRRAFLIVLDSVGIGDAPDAAAFGDVGAHTLGHICDHFQGRLKLPNLASMGLGCITPLRGIDVPAHASCHYGRLTERSAGKDTTTGHWELAGLTLETPFPTYPQGFPAEIVAAFEAAIGRKTLGNCAASGTEIIASLGDEHVATGAPIVYTSADSVFQLAAHVDVIDLAAQYEMCKKARTLMTGPHAVGRVIARPFGGESGAYERVSAARKDFSLIPPQPTILDALLAAGRDVIGIGKISDIFAAQGVTSSHPTGSNEEGMARLVDMTESAPNGALVFANLVDFDAKYGHRRDPVGYGHALEVFDAWIPSFLSRLREDDLLLITADHGNDPTYAGTDHTRERVPLLAWTSRIAAGQNLGILDGFTWVAGTIGSWLGVAAPDGCPTLDLA